MNRYYLRYKITSLPVHMLQYFYIILILLHWFRWKSIVGSHRSLSNFSRPPSRLTEGGVIITTGLVAELEDTENSSNSFSNLVDRAVISTVNNFQRLDHVSDFTEPIASFLLLIFEQTDQSFDLVKRAFPLDAVRGCLHNLVGFFSSHQVESSLRAHAGNRRYGESPRRHEQAEDGSDFHGEMLDKEYCTLHGCNLLYLSREELLALGNLSWFGHHSYI